MPQISLIGTLFDGPLDIVGDIHGEIDALHDLLRNLGYGADGEHPGGRRLIFIGDLTDRGPDSPAVIAFVAGLVRRKLAQCLLGNHELNLLRAARKEGNGWHFEDNHDHRAGKFVSARALAPEHRMSLQNFLEDLPVALERGDLRLVHAAWDPPSIAEVRASSLTVLELYETYDRAGVMRARDAGLEERARVEHDRLSTHLKDPSYAMPILRSVGALEECHQMSNPVRIITSGIERAAEKPFFASGKWRMSERVAWWEQYRDETPVVIGHYWRWPSAEARAAHSRGEPDMFEGFESHRWLGARHNVFCVDFAVGARFKERASGKSAPFKCRLAAMRWPEQQLVFDDGERMQSV